MNNNEKPSISPQEKEILRIMQEWRLDRFRIRLSECLKKVTTPPFLGVIPIILVIVWFIAFLNRSVLFENEVFKDHVPDFFLQLTNFENFTIGIISFLYIFILISIAFFIGTPKSAKNDEEALMYVFNGDGFYRKRIVKISHKTLKNGAIQRCFFTKAVPIDEWEVKKNSIQQRLNCTILSIENIEDNHQKIAITSVYGIPPERNTPSDPYFR